MLFVGLLIRRDGHFLLFTILACAIAAVVGSFQYSVYTSFVRASAIVPRMIGGDVWISAATVECFDFPTPINADYASLVSAYFPEAQFRRVVFGFAPWRSPGGRRGNVAVVGIDDVAMMPDTFLIDESDAARLDLSDGATPGLTQATIGQASMTFAGKTDRIATFLGAPYVVMPIESAHTALGMDSSSTSFLVGNFPSPMHNLPAIKAAIGREQPDIALHSTQDFITSSARYWQQKTGAGMAILLAAVLALLLMGLLMANGIQRFVARFADDLRSLIGHGAGTRELTMIVALVSLIILVTTWVAALAITPLLVTAVQPLLPWVNYAITDSWVPSTAMVTAAIASQFLARRDVLSISPETIFRS
ncbi:MAG: hypothetical protein ABL909_08420 [Sphingopyxis sp.]